MQGLPITTPTLPAIDVIELNQNALHFITITVAFGIFTPTSNIIISQI